MSKQVISASRQVVKSHIQPDKAIIQTLAGKVTLSRLSENEWVFHLMKPQTDFETAIYTRRMDSAFQLGMEWYFMSRGKKLV